METYIVRINGEEYEVEIEKKDGAAQSSQPKATKAPAKAAKAPKKASAPSGAASGTPVVCGTSGKVWKVERKAGDAVKTGDTIIILEAMKMEIPVVAPCDGTVAQIAVSEGDAVASGQAVAYVE